MKNDSQTHDQTYHRIVIITPSLDSPFNLHILVEKDCPLVSSTSSKIALLIGESKKKKHFRKEDIGKIISNSPNVDSIIVPAHELDTGIEIARRHAHEAINTSVNRARNVLAKLQSLSVDELPVETID